MDKITVDEILNCPGLPSLPAAAVEVLELTKDKNVNLRKIAEVVQNDPALTAKILKTVNSSYYGLSRPCPTILRALTYLGLNTVKSLVLGFSLVDVTKKAQTDFDFSDFWQRSLYSAAAARRIAMIHDLCDPEEAFIGALMQDIGMLALQVSVPQQYGAIVARTNGDHSRLLVAETDALGFDHCTVGGAFGDRWRLPSELSEAIRCHHRPDDVPVTGEDLVPFVRTVSLSVDLVIAITAASPDAQMRAARALATEWFSFNDADIDALVQQITEDAGQLAQLFKVDLPSAPDINRVLAEAEDIAMQTQLEQLREVQELRQSNQTLAVQASMDALTNVANRATFDTAIAMHFDDAVARSTSLGLLVVDVDHFKRFNDDYGHPAGDAVLVELARRMCDAVRDHDLVCRYGGEEFAVIVPGADQRTTLEIGERLRELASANPIAITDLDGAERTVSVTVSVGISACDDSNREIITSSARLIQAADRALYAAKEGGRNCVRFFQTRESKAA